MDNPSVTDVIMAGISEQTPLWWPREEKNRAANELSEALEGTAMRTLQIGVLLGTPPQVLLAYAMGAAIACFLGGLGTVGLPTFLRDRLDAMDPKLAPAVEAALRDALEGGQ